MLELGWDKNRCSSSYQKQNLHKDLYVPYSTSILNNICSLLVLQPLASDCGRKFQLQQHKAKVPDGVSFLLKITNSNRKYVLTEGK